MDELDVMRQQLADMKRQLDTQQIVNQELVRKVMRGKASWMDTFVKAEVIIIPVIIFILLAISRNLGISLWYAVAFFILAVIDVIGDFYTVRIPARLFATSSIIDLRKFLVRQKKYRFYQTIVALTLTIIWVALFAYQISCHVALIGMNVGFIVGAVVGIIFVVALYRKMQRTNDQILSDISQLESED